jgi:ABC-2 type transport system permease protein
MLMDKVWEIVRKEWSEVFKNRIVLFAVVFMPILFIILPLGILYSMRGSADAEISGMMTDMPEQFASICEGLSATACSKYFLISQFMILFLLMPVIIPVTIASYSIVGEKTTKTLEPVLATPITTLELLLGKALAGVIPALSVTWISYIIFVVGTRILSLDASLARAVFAPIWLISIFGIGSLLSVSGVSISIMISSRVNDPRVAEQLSSLVAIPLIALFMGQSFGVIQFDLTLVLWVTFGMLVLDAVLLYFAIQLFQRETILTRWK